MTISAYIKAAGLVSRCSEQFRCPAITQEDSKILANFNPIRGEGGGGLFIFKLIGLYVYHTGSLPNLKEYLIDNDAILNCLQENLIAFRTIVKDGLYLERVNKLNSKYRNKPEFQKSENNINSQENNYIDMYDSRLLYENRYA